MNEIQLTIAKIRKGLSLYIICSLAAVILGVITTITSGAAILSAVGGGGAGMGVSAILLMVLTSVASLGVLYGIFVWRGGLVGFATHLDPVGAAAAKKLATALLLMLINSALAIIAIFVPLVFAIPMLILAIIAFILNILGYSALSGSTTLNELGKAGAKKLFLGFILAIVGAVIGFIPVVGDFVEIVLDILYYVFLFKGWAMIQQSFSTEQ